MKRLFLSLYLLILTNILYAEKSNLDSLERDSTIETEQKVRSLINLIKHSTESDTLKLIKYEEQLLQLKLNALHDSTQLNIVKEIIEYYKGQHKYEFPINFLSHQIKVAEKNNRQSLAGNLHYYIISLLYFQNSLELCDYHTDRAIEYFDSLKKNQLVGRLLMYKSNIQYAQSNYEEALNYTFRAIEVFKKYQNQEKLALAYFQIGNIFYYLDNYNESKKFYEFAYNWFQKTNNKWGLNSALSNIGLINLRFKNYKTSIEQAHATIPYFKANSYNSDLTNSYQNLSEAYLELNKLDSAAYYNKLALELSFHSKNFKVYSDIILIASKIEYKKNNTHKAIQLGLRSFNIADSLNIIESAKLAAIELSKYFEMLDKPDSSLIYLKIYTGIRDSLLSKSGMLKDYTLKHKLRIEETEYNLLLSQEKEKMQIERNNMQRKQLIIALIVTIGSLFLSAMCVVTLIKNERLTKELANKQVLIEKELVIKESLLKEIHHRVKNNLQVVSSMLNLQANHIKDKRISKVVFECRNRIETMSIIHQNLYRREACIEAPFSDYIKTLVPQLIEAYKLDQYQLEVEMNLENIHLNLDESIPCGLLINEIISNALKYAFPEGSKGKLSIDLAKKEEQIHLQISDNGIGSENKPNKGKQESFGFLLIDTLVKQLEADLNCSNDNGMKYNIKWNSFS